MDHKLKPRWWLCCLWGSHKAFIFCKSINAYLSFPFLASFLVLSDWEKHHDSWCISSGSFCALEAPLLRACSCHHCIQVHAGLAGSVDASKSAKPVEMNRRGRLISITVCFRWRNALTLLLCWLGTAMNSCLNMNTLDRRFFSWADQISLVSSVKGTEKLKGT